MKITKVQGMHRTVFIVPSLGIVVKFPVSRLGTAWQHIKYLTRKRKTLYKEIFVWDLRVENTLKNYLFMNLYQNWSEFTHFLRYRHPFTQPTYFSLFGFVNFQKLGDTLEMNYVDLWYQMLDLIGKEAAWRDAHHFSEPTNFCVVDGHLKMVDYGSEASRSVVNEFGTKLYNDFDVTYVRPKTKTE